MKKFTLLALICLLFSLCSQATVTFTLITPPCDTNGIITVHFATGIPPYRVEWRGGCGKTGSAFLNCPTTSCTISNYSGSACRVSVYDSTYNLIDTGSFAGLLPFDFTFGPHTYVGPSTVSASVIVSGGTPPYTYAWFPDRWPDSIIATTNPAAMPFQSFWVPHHAGIYGVWIKDAAGCLNSSTLKWAEGTFPYCDTIPFTTSISLVTSSKTELLSLHPNPTSSTFNALINSANSGSAIMHITDISGKLVLSKPIDLKEGNQTISTDIGELLPGVYVVSLKSSEKTELQKLVIIR